MRVDMYEVKIANLTGEMLNHIGKHDSKDARGVVWYDESGLSS